MMEHAKRIVAGALGGFVVLLLIISTAMGARPLAIPFTPTAFVYLPFIPFQPMPGPTPTPTLTPTPEPTARPTPYTDLQIIALSGLSAPEYVTIQNFGDLTQNMTGWYLVSVIGAQTFYFPTGYTLAPGMTVTIESYNGAIDNPPSILFWTSEAIWNNAGDKAELRNSSGSLISSACYGNACP